MLTEGVSWFFLHSLQNSKNTAWPSVAVKKIMVTKNTILFFGRMVEKSMS